MTAQTLQPQELLNAGLELMLAGMGTVFLFLMLLVLATIAMSAAIQRWLISEAHDPGTPTPEELAAITAAIHQHRQGRP